jgi:hypothetical protein
MLRVLLMQRMTDISPKRAVLWVPLPCDVLKASPILCHEFGQLLHDLPHVRVLWWCRPGSKNWRQGLTGRVSLFTSCLKPYTPERLLTERLQLAPV